MNFLLKYMQEIHLNSENIVRDRFQKQFYQLIEEDIITLKKMEGRPSIYKMGTVKKIKECTVRKLLDLHVDAQAEPQAIKILDSIYGRNTVSLTARLDV